MSSRLVTDYSHLDTSQFPPFMGFPYLVTHLIPSLHHIILLPKTLDTKSLMDLAIKQAIRNRLESCLVLDEKTCLYFDTDGVAEMSNMIPRGAFVAIDKLKLSKKIYETIEMASRREELLDYEISINGNVSRCLIADPKKGGRFPLEDELWKLKGLQWNGIPKGLEQCASCSEWKGECIDPSIETESLMVKVECICANNNRCAGCGVIFYSRKLNANYLKDGEVWHVPGFVALNHKCKE